MSRSYFFDERLCREIDDVDVGQRFRVEVFVPRSDGRSDVDADVTEERLVVVLNDCQKVVLENLKVENRPTFDKESLNQFLCKLFKLD